MPIGKDTVLSPKTVFIRLQAIRLRQEEGRIDRERDHLEADKLLTQLLKYLEHYEIVAEYEGISKRHS